MNDLKFKALLHCREREKPTPKSDEELKQIALRFNYGHLMKKAPVNE